MHFDEKRYPDPEKFNVGDLPIPLRTLMLTQLPLSPTQPDRYLGDHYTNAESANLADPMLRDHWMFGAG